MDSYEMPNSAFGADKKDLEALEKTVKELSEKIDKLARRDYIVYVDTGEIEWLPPSQFDKTPA